MSALLLKRLFSSTSFVATLKVLEKGRYTWRHDQRLKVLDAIPTESSQVNLAFLGDASSKTQLEDKPGV